MITFIKMNMNDRGCNEQKLNLQKILSIITKLQTKVGVCPYLNNKSNVIYISTFFLYSLLYSSKLTVSYTNVVPDMIVVDL